MSRPGLCPAVNSMARMSFLLLNACVTWRCHSVKRIWLSFRIGITQALINWLRKACEMPIRKLSQIRFTEWHLQVTHAFKSKNDILAIEFTAGHKPGRDVKFHAVTQPKVIDPSSFEIFQRSARLGWIFGVSLLRSKSSSLLKTVSATAEYSTPLEYRPGSKPAGLPSEQ